jgi:hypothetical protein
MRASRPVWARQQAGQGDAAAAAAAGQGEGEGASPAGPAPPMLDPLDILPDRPIMLLRAWPYYQQLYSGGDACSAEGRRLPRRVELRVACSPDARLHMLVREPEFCRWARRARRSVWIGSVGVWGRDGMNVLPALA